MIQTTIYMEPVAKGRARVTVRGGHAIAYTPQKTVVAEQFIRYHVMDLKQSYNAGVPLRLEATFYRRRPKHLAKKVTMPVQRPDWDNYAKLLMDALEKYAYHDDAQITTALIRKRFGEPPRIELKITKDLLK